MSATTAVPLPVCGALAPSRLHNDGLSGGYQNNWDT
jgi:hypothetical protein